MADIRPFPGLRFDPRRAPLSRVLCPPYDVIDAEQAAALRGEEVNAIHLELPSGEGQAKYQGAAGIWRRWRASGLLSEDQAPSLYVCEERYKAQGRAMKRTGFLAALSVKPGHAGFVVPHERTLSKPKEDRLSLLSAVRANISPIFGIFPDPSGAVRRALAKAKAKRPSAQGAMRSGVRYRLWALSDPKLIAATVKALAPRRVLIADGHHRYEVSRAYYERQPAAGADTVLAYLCPEEDAGLIVLPTHRVVEGVDVAAESARLCRVRPCASRAEVLRRLAASPNPYAYGYFSGGGFALAEPKGRDGCKSGMCVEWLGRKLLSAVSPERIRYTPDAAKAAQWAVPGWAAVFVKASKVPQIRKAVRAVGLLPQKSTYFYPKIATGLVFKSLEAR